MREGNDTQYFKTSEIARAAGLHPNTIRLYEEWGFLPAIPRTPAGYRMFTQEHIDQVKLIRLVLKCTLFGKGIKKTAYQIIHLAAEANYDGALQYTVILDELIQKECYQAEQAEKFLKQWACEKNAVHGDAPGSVGYEALTVAPNRTALPRTDVLSTSSAAKMLEITIDMLRDWERNNLIQIPRNPINGYRVFGPDDINKLRVIRALRRSQYSNMSILRAMRKLESSSTEGLREALDSPEVDEERGYLCFTDNLLSSLYAAKEAVEQILRHLRNKEAQNKIAPAKRPGVRSIYLT